MFDSQEFEESLSDNSSILSHSFKNLNNQDPEVRKKENFIRNQIPQVITEKTEEILINDETS